MGISATNSRYDNLLLHRQNQRDAADLREARSAARKAAAEKTLAQSDTLRNSVTNIVAQSGADQSNLTSVEFIGPLFRMSRRTDMLSARTCALGWERQRMVGDRRHCKSHRVSISNGDYVFLMEKV